MRSHPQTRLARSLACLLALARSLALAAVRIIRCGSGADHYRATAAVAAAAAAAL
jgi:hypothetical protein